MLRLSHKARNSVQSGHILDLVSTDAEKLDWVRTLYMYDVRRIDWQTRL